MQIRQLAVESGLLNAADGSARWSQDNTEVLAAVNGPRQVAAYKVCPSPGPSSPSLGAVRLQGEVLAAPRGGDVGGSVAYRRVQIGR